MPRECQLNSEFRLCHDMHIVQNIKDDGYDIYHNNNQEETTFIPNEVVFPDEWQCDRNHVFRIEEWVVNVVNYCKRNREPEAQPILYLTTFREERKYILQGYEYKCIM